jgi:hypothetical protein
MDFGVYTMVLVWVLKFTQRHKLQPVLVSYIGLEIEINTGIKYQTSPVWYDISLVPAWYEYQLGVDTRPNTGYKLQLNLYNVTS